ncbi:hypothetical protein [Mesorhizobium sp. INR15]|uniref:hypothetical protein n=1 Tax=Mesorhizobium sp. INR15 TaxID=2654248 RepID=UPI00189679D1|nr:hypothetical protein [Mesorhizobium sp. INR15]QPC90023.1 hypothetical protein GA829_05140 [Mesorhizobium sp. INR15]
MQGILIGAAVLAAGSLLFASATLFRAAVIHLTARSDVIRDAEAHSPRSPSRVIKGEVETYKSNNRRDASIAAGVARDRRANRIVLQGRVSDEVLETLV